MLRKLMLLTCALAGAGWVQAQQTQDVDPELLAYIAEIEANVGMKRFGPVRVGELEGFETATVTVDVNPSTYTAIAVICGPSCEQITGAAFGPFDKEIAKAAQPGYEAVIQVPPGNGASVEVKVDMIACEWETCPFAIQAFTPPAGQ